MSSLREQVAKAKKTIPRDVDPESHDPFAHTPDSDSELEGDNEEFTGREHYETVGKSRLRKPPQPTLGKQYEGSTVSRLALNGDDNDEDDPLAPEEIESDDDALAKHATDDDDESQESAKDAGSDADMAILDGEVEEDDDEEIDSDEAFGDEDIEKFKSFKFSGSKSGKHGLKSKPGVAGEDEDDDSDMEDVDLPDSDGVDEDVENDEDAEVGSAETVSGADESDDGSASTASTSPEETFDEVATPSSNRAALKAILANDSAAVASTLSAAADSDAKKGKAVKQQYQTFDRLLDARIKLQKGLTTVNSLSDSFSTESTDRLTVAKAEEAALSLWSTIESIRHSLLDTQSSTSTSTETSKKRKRPSPATSSTPTSKLWTRTRDLESASLPHRRAVLDKWSAKARAATAVPAPRSQLVDRSSQTQNKITSVLDTYLASESQRLIANASSTLTTTNSSQATQSPSYDDSPFYQSLLRDLISSRSATSTLTTASTATTTINNILPSRFNTRGSKNKNIDTKASKGRKVRYTVHEKLQNFAAEEERGTWEERARREFFGSLFGGKGALDENDAGVEDQNGVPEDGEAEALRLFRS